MSQIQHYRQLSRWYNIVTGSWTTYCYIWFPPISWWHTGNFIVNDTVTLDGGGSCKCYFFFWRQMFRPTPDQCLSQALRVLIGHQNFRLCQGLCQGIANFTISTMYPTIETQSHSSYFNPTFPFSISLFPFWIPLSIYNPTIKISIPLFQVIPLPLSVATARLRLDSAFWVIFIAHSW